MDLINDYADILLEFLITYFLMPAVGIVFGALRLLIEPISGLRPSIQILVVAFVAALVARVLGVWMKKRRDLTGIAVFKEKMDAIRSTGLIHDKRKRHILKREINDSADDLYMKIFMDRFFESGVTFLLPMFFFLFFLSYDLFTPEKLLALTGSEYAISFTGGARLTTSYFYVLGFYAFYAGITLLGKVSSRFNPLRA